MAEEMSRKALREAKAKAAREAKMRDEQRVAVERDYARGAEKHPEKVQRFDEQTYYKQTGLKQKLNFAIGLTSVLIVIVMLVMFFL